MKFDLYGTLMINRRNRVLIVFHLYSCSKHKLSMILMAQTLLKYNTNDQNKLCDVVLQKQALYINLKSQK